MRIFYFSILICIGFFLPFWAFVVASCMYALLYIPYEILILALFIDAEFGDFGHSRWYMYTIAAAGVLVSTTFVKPYLRFYQK